MQVLPQALPFTQTLQHCSRGTHEPPASASLGARAGSAGTSLPPGSLAHAQPGVQTPKSAKPKTPAATRFRTKSRENINLPS